MPRPKSSRTVRRPSGRATTHGPGDAAVAFLNNLTHTGDFAGEPFCLRPWQESVVRTLFGTIRPDGLRQYRRAFLALPRKQGKTELAAAILLYLLLGTGKKDQRLYSASGDRAQASLIFHAAATMIRADPTLDSLCHVYDGYKRIVYEPGNSTYEALSSEAYSKHGLGPSAVLFDEVHVLPDREFHNVLTTGFGARKEPLVLYITTAGHDRTSLCWELWDYARKVRDKVIDDPKFLPILYEADPKDDWKDPATWHKAMPALGDFCSLEFIEDECKRATELPSYENTFRQLYLNQWTEQAERWLSVERWQECGGLDESVFDGRDCYAGYDAGVTGDMTALTLAFPNEAGGFDLKPHYWVPRDGKWRREPRNCELYELWERQGYLTFTEGEATDFDLVERDILAANERWPFRQIYADRAYATQMLNRLYNLYGLPVKGITQGPVTLNEAMVRLEEMILDRSVRHTGHPVLAWNIANATVKRGPTGLMHLDKSGNTLRIDGLAAAINAITAAIADDDKSSPYTETRGLIVL